MSYDLVFWREQAGTRVDVQAALHLTDTEELPGLIPLPLAEVEAAFLGEFPEAVIGGADIDWEGAGSYFQVGYTFADERHVSTISVTCGYLLLEAPEAFGRLRHVADALGCCYHDLQPSEPDPAAKRASRGRNVWTRLRRLFSS